MWNLDLQTEILQDRALIEAASGNKTITPLSIAHALFTSPMRETQLSACFERLLAAKDSEDRYHNVRALVKIVLIKNSVDPAPIPALQALLERAAKLFNFTVVMPNGPIAQLGRFPEANIPITRFRSVSCDEAFQDHLEEEVTRHTVLDPTLAAAGRACATVPGAPFCYENYAVGLPGVGEMVLVPAPTKHTLTAYYEMVLRKNARALVTLCSPYENTRAIPFWEAESLAKLTLDKGWKIELQSTEVIYRSKTRALVPQEVLEKYPGRDFHPQIVARRFNATNGQEEKVFHHLHYCNWPDNQGVPDLAGLVELFKYRHKQTLDDKDPKAAVFNCMYGIGRTAIAAVIDTAWQKIVSQTKLGKKPAEIQVNLPEILYAIRRKLPYIGGIDFHFGTVYSVLAELCESQGLIP